MASLFDMARVTIGADPELFVAKRGVAMSGHDLPLGTKDNPKKTMFGHVQRDGMAVEVNVLPSHSKISFITNCAEVLNDLEKIIKATDREMYLMCEPKVRFDPEYMKTVPEDAKELGCNPDWNAYEMQENPRPDADSNLRTAGGHIHIGWGSGFNCSALEHIGLCAEVAKQLDYYIGVPSLEWDKDTERRSLYGQAGAFRPKPYGMEYRVLSPMWLLSVPHTGLVFDRALKALSSLNHGRILDEEFDGLAREIINKNEYNWRGGNPELEKALAE